jgi:glycosyltransferase involved in cell wall biosynthesis
MQMQKPKLIRITTVPVSLKILLKGQHRFMSEYFEVIGISSSGSDLLDVQKDEGITVIPVELTRTISPLKDLRSVYKLYRIFSQEKPQIVHTHTPKAGTLGMIAAKLAGVPLRLHTVAGLPLLETKGVKRKLLNLVEKITYSCATNLYPNSKGLYSIILKHKFCRKEKMKVIANGSSNGIDVSHFDPSRVTSEEKTNLKRNLGITDLDTVFIFVGRLVSDKGINELIKAFSILSEKEKNIKLLLVGPTERNLDPLLPETISKMDSNDKILEVGFQKDVRPFFAVSNALVFPTYREGFPNVVMQAGAMGLRAIVTDINGCNEIIVEGENGTIIPTKSEAHLREAMLNFTLNKDKLEAKHAKYRKMIVDRYDQNIIWRALLKEYQELLVHV